MFFFAEHKNYATPSEGRQKKKVFFIFFAAKGTGGPLPFFQAVLSFFYAFRHHVKNLMALHSDCTP